MDLKLRQHKLQNLGYGTISYNTVLTTPQKSSNWDKFIQNRVQSLDDSSLKDKTLQTSSKETTKRRMHRILGNTKITINSH